MKRFVKKEVALAVALSLSGTAVSSLAIADDDMLMLEEIVVTAQKREQNLQDVPVAITAIQGDSMAAMGVTDISDLQAHIPNISTYPARGTSSTLTAYIRGIGQSDPLFGVDPGVGLYFDDVYIARPQGALMDIFDVERVEVLRGPQGTLYGKNTIGGAIKYVSKPLEYERSGSFSVAYGDYSQQEVKGDFNMPLIDDKLVMKVAGASITRREGFSKSVYTGSDHISDKEVYSGRLALQWNPTDNFEAKFSADYTADRSGALGPTLLKQNPNDIVLNAPGAALLGDEREVRSGFKNKNDTETQGYSLTLTADLSDEMTVKSITAYRKGSTDTYIDFDTLPQPYVDVRAIYEDNQFSQEFQFNYNADNWNLVSGLYYFTGDAGGQVWNQFLIGLPASAIAASFAGALGVPTYEALTGLSAADIPSLTGSYNVEVGQDTDIPGVDGNVKTTSYSLYSQANIDLTETVTLSLGGRLTIEEKEADVYNTSDTSRYFDSDPGLNVFNSFNTFAVDADFEDSETFREFSPRVGLDWQINEDVMVYASYSEGFKSGGFNVRAKNIAVTGSDKPYEPETVKSIELGTKATLWDGRMTLNAAIFRNKYEDIQLSVFTDDGAGGFFGDFKNAGEGTMQGAELEMTALLAEGLTLNASVGFLDAEYDELESGGVNIASNEEFTNAPRLTYNIGFAYDFSVGDMGDVLARVDYAWRDDSVLTTEFQTGQTDPLQMPLEADDYGVLNAAVVWDMDENWRFTFAGKNLTDEEYLVTGYNITSVGVRTGFLGEPRTWSMEASYSF